MNRSLEVFTKLYKPYKITKVNSVYVFNTSSGDYVIKLNPKIDYKKLYSYLNTRSFSYVPELSLDSRDDMVVLKYVEDSSIDDEQKALDLINLVALLHSKTSFFKEVLKDKYKELYDDIKSYILYLKEQYDSYFNLFLEEEYTKPSHYLFLRNYSLINGAFSYSLDLLDKWFNLVKDNDKQRVVLVHNNLKLEHYIKNTEEYLISWDNYLFDTPVLDLYHLYLNEWENVNFSVLLSEYESSFGLLDDEKMLFSIIISVPIQVDFSLDEFDSSRNIRRLINYLNKSVKNVLEWPE